MSAKEIGGDIKEVDEVPIDQSVQETPITDQKREHDVKQIEQLWTDGFKCYVSEDFDAAVDKLSMATQLSASLFGEFAPQGFQLYYYYGRSLVEIARSEIMLVNPKTAEKEDDSSAGEEIQVKEDGQENSGEVLPQFIDAQNPAVGGDSHPPANTEKDSEPAVEDDAKPGDEMQDTDEQVLENGEQVVDDDDDDDEVLNTAKLAWENLEVARRICEKQEQSKEWLEKKADVLLSLGECMLVDENFGNASDEFNSALEIQKSLFEPEDRRIADTLFHIALSHKIGNDFDNAALYFDKAAEVFKLTIECAAKRIGEGEDSTIATEISEMKQILKDIQDQAQDSRESAVARRAQLEEKGKEFVARMFPEVPSDNAGNEEVVVVNDISSLIHRKSIKRPAAAGGVEEMPIDVVEGSGAVDPAVDAKISEPSDKKAKLGEGV